MPEDLIQLINKKSTPIAYPEANKRNAQDRAEFKQNPDNAGKAHIQSYFENSYIVKGPPPPEKAGPAARVHSVKTEPGPTEQRVFLASQEHLRRAFEQSPQQKPADIAKSVLDLPPAQTAAYISRADIYPGFYEVELSFNRKGHPQATVDKNHVRYSGTKKTNDFDFKP